MVKIRNVDGNNNFNECSTDGFPWEGYKQALRHGHQYVHAQDGFQTERSALETSALRIPRGKNSSSRLYVSVHTVTGAIIIILDKLHQVLTMGQA